MHQNRGDDFLLLSRLFCVTVIICHVHVLCAQIGNYVASKLINSAGNEQKAFENSLKKFYKSITIEFLCTVWSNVVDTSSTIKVNECRSKQYFIAPQVTSTVD